MSDEPTYEELLKDKKWLETRKRILRRDNHMCQMCGSHENLNMHHRYYLYMHYPWAYNDNALITLCKSCHLLVHNTLSPIVYAQKGSFLKPMKFTPCRRCNGYGYLSEYNHVQGGLCFRCKGMKYEELINITSYESMNKYVDYNGVVYDSIDSISIDELESIFQVGLSFHKSNPQEAKKYYLRVAKQGYGKAQNNLGMILQEEGHIAQAKRWFLYSAMQGIGQGKHNLIELLYKTKDSAYKGWLHFLSNDEDFQAKIFFRIFVKFLKNTIENKAVPANTEIYAMLKLKELADKGNKIAIDLVEQYRIDLILNEFKKESGNGDSD